MKKILSALFISMLSFHAFAQDASKTEETVRKFRFGLKAAPSVAWMKPDNSKMTRGKSKVKFGYGLISEFRLNDIAGFATGLEVVYTGGGINFTDSVYYSTSGHDILSDPTAQYLLKNREYRLQYVNIPLALKMKTKEIGLLSYYGQFGFDMGIKAKARAEDEGYLGFITNKNTVSTLSDVEIKSDAGFLRMALNIGFGVEYGLVGSTVLVGGLNYSNGFTNALHKESIFLRGTNNKFITQKASSNYISLTVGIIF